MAPPTKLSVATSSVTRLLKEEGSYHKELEQQQARITRTEKEARGENAEFQIRQEVEMHLSICRDFRLIIGSVGPSKKLRRCYQT